jgi:hypothetical protein
LKFDPRFDFSDSIQQFETLKFGSTSFHLLPVLPTRDFAVWEARELPAEETTQIYRYISGGLTPSVDKSGCVS